MKKNPGGPREWRTHFHVPVFLEDLGPYFKTTRFAIEERRLRFISAHPGNPVGDRDLYPGTCCPMS